IVRWMSRSAWVVTSPMTTQSPLVIAVSHATRACSSWASMPSSTASETWSQILSGWPSVTDSEVRRKEREEAKDVVTKADDNLRLAVGLRSDVLPAVLRFVCQQARLEGEDVVEDAVDPPALEPVVGDHSRPLEAVTQGRPEEAIDAGLAAHLRLFQQLQAPVQRELPRPVCSEHHSGLVPRTSTLPAAVTRAWTGLRLGSE